MDGREFQTGFRECKIDSENRNKCRDIKSKSSGLRQVRTAAFNFPTQPA